MVEWPGGKSRQFFGKLNGGLGRGIKKRGVIRKPPHLISNGIDDFGAAVSDVDAPKSGEAVKQSAAMRVAKENAFAFHKNLRAERVKFLVIGKRVEMKLPIKANEIVEGIHGEIFTEPGSFAKCRVRAQTLQVNASVTLNDLAPGDAKSASLDLACFQIDRIRSIDDPLFEAAYEKLWAEFGEKGEMESRETLACRFQLGPAMLYEIVFVRCEGEFAAVRDHTAILAGDRVVVHLSHNLIAANWRRTGLAGWMRTFPLGTGRECALANGFSTTPGMVLAAEMEYAAGNDPQQAIRLRAYEKAGFLKVDPRVFKYHQPDFRAPAEIDVIGGARPLSLQLLLRFPENAGETISGQTLRQIVMALYRMYGAQFRPEDMAHPALSSENWPALEAAIELLPPTFEPD